MNAPPPRAALIGLIGAEAIAAIEAAGCRVVPVESGRLLSGMYIHPDDWKRLVNASPYAPEAER